MQHYSVLRQVEKSAYQYGISIGYFQKTKPICRIDRYASSYRHTAGSKQVGLLCSSKKNVNSSGILTNELNYSAINRSYASDVGHGKYGRLKYFSFSRHLSDLHLVQREDDKSGLKTFGSQVDYRIKSEPRTSKSVINLTVDQWRNNDVSGSRQHKRHMSTSGQSVNLDKQSRDREIDGGEGKEANVKSIQHIPGPIGLPYLGVLPLFITDGRLGVGYKVDHFHNFLVSCYRRYGHLFKVKINGQTTVHIFDPDLIQKVYLNVGRMPDIVPLLVTTQMYRKFRNMSLGLGNTNGEEWYRMRTAVQQIMMVPRTVPAFLPQVNTVADEFITSRLDRLRDRETGLLSNLRNEISKWNLESSAMTCFETSLGCLSEDAECSTSWQQRMIDANNEIFRLSTSMYFSLPWHLFIKTPTWKRLIESEDFFFGNGQRLVDETCAKIRRQMEEVKQQQTSETTVTEGEGWTFLRYLMKKCESSDGTFTYKDLSIITLSLFADGLSTTSPSLVGQLYCLATNEEKQNKLYDEIRRIAPDQSQPITDDVLQQATFLKACIKEGFRFFPVGTDVSRVLNKDIVLGGYHIPAGTPLSLNNNLLLRDEQYFTQAETYLPERWLRESTGRHLHPYLLLPFGHGTRMCAGMRLAEQEMRVLIIKLLQRFRLVVLPTHPPLKQKYRMLLTPDHDPAICFVPRRST